MKLASDLGLIVFCWGDDNNSPDTIRYMKTLGIHGIIYDKMDTLSTKKVRFIHFNYSSKFWWRFCCSVF